MFDNYTPEQIIAGLKAGLFVVGLYAFVAYCMYQAFMPESLKRRRQ